MDKGLVVWLTGLPGSGKTTIARKLAASLRSRGFNVEVLDGDEVRKWLSPEAGFSREDRERHLRRVAHVSKLLARNGVTVVASFVSPYRRVREEARRIIEDDGSRFIEVYVKCSLETCLKRDPKGLYKKALEGRIKDMTGVQDSYEEPLNPEVVVDTEEDTAEGCVKTILSKLKEVVG
ncbi:TPA: adenylyl-sulfate kinase [Candidatus Bathyarchaeota archaeon]|nr:adenylyl-sulfate kinase [Candidatus Bathyarchaeota archaeon]